MLFAGKLIKLENIMLSEQGSKRGDRGLSRAVKRRIQARHLIDCKNLCTMYPNIAQQKSERSQVFSMWKLDL
jgi:hypothetical protein